MPIDRTEPLARQGAGRILFFAALVALCCPPAAVGGEAGSAYENAFEVPVGAPVYSPPPSINTPVATGAAWGDFVFSAAIANRIRYGSNPDGVIQVGSGLGNPVETVGVEVVAVLPDIVGDIFGTGALNVKVHRAIGDDWSIAVGIESAISWGRAVLTGPGGKILGGGYDLSSSSYLVLSRFLEVSNGGIGNLTLTLGVGDGRFRSEEQTLFQRGAFKGPYNIFGSLAISLGSHASLIGNWTGQDLYAGVAVTPFRAPVSLSFSAADLLHRAGDGVRFMFGVAMSPTFDTSGFL